MGESHIGLPAFQRVQDARPTTDKLAPAHLLFCEPSMGLLQVSRMGSLCCIGVSAVHVVPSRPLHSKVNSFRIFEQIR